MDEVGAGCLAGPVVAGCFAYKISAEWCAADELPVRIFDSKKLSDIRRAESSQYLSAGTLSHAVHTIVEISNERIDEINILWARMEAMWNAFIAAHTKMSEKLGTSDFLWRAFVDGNRFPREVETWHMHPQFSSKAWLKNMPKAPFRTVIQGDSKVFAIAAASIIAKEYRDSLMAELGELPEYRAYGWPRNVGYPTPDHQEAIRQVGLSNLHRRSFRSGLTADSLVEL